MSRSILAVVGFLLGVMVCVAPAAYAKPAEDDTIRMLELFGDVFERVKHDYVEEVEDKTLLESAINGMLSSLDPHSGYLNEKAFQEMRIQTRGEFGGLGIEVTMENSLVKVVSPIDDTPAYEAGIKAGDYISQIDGESVSGMTLAEAVEKMRGRPGTRIRLTVLREGSSEPLDFTLSRAVIKLQSVRVKQQGDVAYLRITSFSERTAEMAQKELKKVIKDIGPDFKGVVLDLRNNPGGLLDQAIEVSDQFLDKGEIVSTKGRIEDSNKRFNASEGDMIEGKPIVVVVNGGSASASEIVAGALQDHKRAIVIGTRSFGKGSVQTVVPLSASNGAMRLTTSRYYTPSGRSIQAEGIQPDIVVEQAKLEPVDSTPRTTEANLRGHLTNGNNEEEKQDIKTSEAKKDKDDKTDLTTDDYQLARAVDLIRAVALFGSKPAATAE